MFQLKVKFWNWDTALRDERRFYLYFLGYKAYLRAKIEELETNSKIQNIRDLYGGISDFKKGYQPRCNIVKDEKGDLVADSHSIVARWRKYFSQLLNVHGINDMLGREKYTQQNL